MNESEMERLAELIAGELLKRAAVGTDAVKPHIVAQRQSWLPAPVRPAPVVRGGEPPVWSGAAQELEGIAGSGSRRTASPGAGRRYTDLAALAAARSAAAAGAAPGQRTDSERATSQYGKRGSVADEPRAAGAGRPMRASSPRGPNAPTFEVSVGVSRRHLHLSAVDARSLFGTPALTVLRGISQPSQFAAKEVVDVVGPAGVISSVRVVGPLRGETQLEIAHSDARILGVTPPVAASGRLELSSGGVTLRGPAGKVLLTRGVIIASRHLHLSVDDSRRLGIFDGDLLDVVCGTGSRRTTLHGVLVRCSAANSTELHLDSDEAFAAGVVTGDAATVTGWKSGAARRRQLITERDVIEHVRRGEAIPTGAILTPGARDRARALGIPST